MINKKVLVTDVIEFLGDFVLKVYGNQENIYVDNVADVAHVNETTLDWINGAKSNQQEMAENSIAKTIVVGKKVEYNEVLRQQGKVLLAVEKPRMAMARIIGEFFVEKPNGIIHPSAIIEDSAEIAENVSIGAGCVIGKNVTIGKNTILKPNVVLYDSVSIGENCLIQAGTIIGTDGLGCSRDADGTLVKFPHLGSVIIGKNVEIGANCQIAKGVLSDTIIEDGCKINGLCFIAHNCHLEKNVWITGDTMLCGSTHVGKNTTIYSNVIIREQNLIGERVVVGMGSVVTKPIPDGETWVGCPAHKLEKEKK